MHTCSCWWSYNLSFVWVWLSLPENITASCTHQSTVHPTAQHCRLSWEMPVMVHLASPPAARPLPSRGILPMYVIRKHKPWRAASYFPWWHQKCCPRALFLSHLHLPARDVCARALPFGTWQTPSATGESSKRQDWTKWVRPEVTNLHSAKRSIFAKENGIIILSAFFLGGKKGGQTFNLLKKAVSFLHSWPFTRRGNADFLLSYGSDHPCQS